MRGCACDGNQGFAHVSCLVRQDWVLWADNRHEVKGEKIEANFDALLSCKLCKRQYNAAVLHALGWGIWKTQAAGEYRLGSEYAEALSTLGLCLSATGREAEAGEVANTLELLFLGQEKKQQDRERQRQDLTKVLEGLERKGSG